MITLNAGKNVKHRTYHTLLVGKYNFWGGIQFLWKIVWHLHLKHLCLYTHKSVYMNVQNYFIYNSQILENTQMSFNGGIIKQTVTSISWNRTKQ